MDYDLSEQQTILQDAVRKFCRRECPTQRVREIMETDTGYDHALWTGIAEQGLIGLHLPEAAGGLGMSFVDLAVVSEELGRACVPGPFLATTWAATLLAAAESPGLAPERITTLVDGSTRATVAHLEESPCWDSASPRLEASFDGDICSLNGAKQLVLDAEVADVILVTAIVADEPGIVLLEREDEGVRVVATPGIDATRRLYRVELDNVSVPRDRVVDRGESALAAIAHGMRVGAMAVCAELVGGMSWMLGAAVEYAGTRKQFGKPIGAFQAVQQLAADMLLWTESSRSAAYWAAWTLGEGGEDVDRAVSIAKVYCSDAARETGNNCVQVHGGIGFTWEHDLHLFYKRARANEYLFGDATFHRERIARLAIEAM